MQKKSCQSAEDSRILGGYDFKGWTRSNGQPLAIFVGDEIQKTLISVISV